MRTCVIFNPAAKGEKARRFRRCLDDIGREAGLKLTAGPGDARGLAAEAVAEGYVTIVAAGGDGTVNEVLNGIGDAPEGFTRARLAVLPLGTVNVFARELGIPFKPELAWAVARAGQEKRIDLPHVQYRDGEKSCRRYFAQLAGAGLDARAVELVTWELKKRIGKWAYILAGLQALAGPPAKIAVSSDGHTAKGALVLVGNGRLYGGPYRIFPKAELTDGLLEICVFPRVNWLTLARCGPRLLLKGELPTSLVQTFQARTLELKGAERVAFEIDGELVGELPARFELDPMALRIVVPHRV